MSEYAWLPDAFMPQIPVAVPTGEESEADKKKTREPVPALPVFTAFDLETTGLDKGRDRIVEIGAVKFDQMGVIARFNVLVNPLMPMPPEASRVNGISDDMLKDKPPITEVMKDFLRFIADSILVAHNAPFDTGFVNEALALLHKPLPEDPSQMSLLSTGETESGSEGTKGRAAAWRAPWPSLPNRIVDTRILARESFPNRPNYKLQDLASWLGIEALAAHRAEDDARVCMDLFIRCIEALISRRDTR